MLAEGQDLPLLVAEALAVPGHDLDLGRALGQLQGRLQRFGEPALDALPEDEAVHHDLDGVHLVASEVGALGHRSASSRTSPSRRTWAKPWVARSARSVS